MIQGAINDEDQRTFNYPTMVCSPDCAGLNQRNIDFRSVCQALSGSSEVKFLPVRDLDDQVGKPRGAYKGMKCPHCGSVDGSRIIDTRDANEARRRRHVCDKCEQRFTTYEISAEEYERLLRVKVDEAGINRAIATLTAIKTQLGATNGPSSQN